MSEQIAVIGLWHLGSVTAACLAEASNEVIAVDPDPAVVAALSTGRPPVAEPGLAELLAQNGRRLRFTTDARELTGVKRAWLTFDTPVDEDDNADVEWVLACAEELLAPLGDGALVIVSSQLPVGSVAMLEERCNGMRGERGGERGLRFACVPENLRLGGALDSFRKPDRIIAGVREEEDRRELTEVLAPFSENVQWMRVESAEMTKHALNGFLATSVAFIDEVAAVCESVGADAAEVARGLKSERRIGPRAYLNPGAAFAGGTLARDLGFLRTLAERYELSAHVFAGVSEGNAAHRSWTRRKLLQLWGEEDELDGRGVAIWGLTYKPGTDTLRRSSAVELCHWLADGGAVVRAHDPAVRALPPDLEKKVELCASPVEAAMEADALVLCTPWPAYGEVGAEALLEALAQPVVVDPTGLLCDALASRPEAHHVWVGKPTPPPMAMTATPPPPFRAQEIREALG